MGDQKTGVGDDRTFYRGPLIEIAGLEKRFDQDDCEQEQHHQVEKVFPAAREFQSQFSLPAGGAES